MAVRGECTGWKPVLRWPCYDARATEVDRHGLEARGTVQTLPTGGGANRGPPFRRPLNEGANSQAMLS